MRPGDPHRLLILLIAIGMSACYQRSESRPQVQEDARDLANGRPTLALSIVPEQLPGEDILRYSHLADRLTAATPHRILLKAAGTSSVALARLRHGEADLAILGAVAFVRARRGFGAVGLARLQDRGRTTCRAAIIVRRDDPAQTIEDLRGRRLGLIDPNSTTGQLLILAGLADAGLTASDLDEIRYFDRQEPVARAVFLNEVDAGAIRDSAADRHESRGLRVLWRSEPLPGRVLVARPGLAPDVVDAIRTAVLMATPVSEEDAQSAGPAAPRFVPILESDDAAVEALMLRTYGPDASRKDLRILEAVAR
jgi:phosphonate transport system substrate-binding protein